jgi:hypothetical protein
MNNYVIIGTGDTSPNIIEDSLGDVLMPRHFHVSLNQTEHEGVCRVYDFLIDKEEKYTGYSNAKAPKLLASKAENVVTSQDVTIDLVDVARKLKATVLYLWDDKNPNAEREVTAMIDQGLTVLDLTEGLAPFRLIDDTVPVPAEDVLPPLSAKDYEKMPRTTLDQQAKAQGLTPSNFSTKEKLIEALLGEPTTPVSADGATVVIVFQDQTTCVARMSNQDAINLANKIDPLTKYGNK